VAEPLAIVCLPGGHFVWAVQVTILDVVDLKNPGAHGLHWDRAAEDPLSPMSMYLPGGHGSDVEVATGPDVAVVLAVVTVVVGVVVATVPFIDVALGAVMAADVVVVLVVVAIVVGVVVVTVPVMVLEVVAIAVGVAVVTVPFIEVVLGVVLAEHSAQDFTLMNSSFVAAMYIQLPIEEESKPPTLHA
jgi:hypothetical protein